MRNSRARFAASTRPSKDTCPPGGAISLALEQADRAGLMERIYEVFKEFIHTRKELGLLLSCAASRLRIHPHAQRIGKHLDNDPGQPDSVVNRYSQRTERAAYEKPSDDLKKLLLGRYGPFPFYDPYEWVLQKVLESGRTDAKSWQQILADETGVQELADVDLNAGRIQLSSQIKRPATDEELCIYAQFPRIHQIRRALRANMAPSS